MPQSPKIFIGNKIDLREEKAGKGVVAKDEARKVV